MSVYSSATKTPSFRTLLDSCAQADDFPFREVLTQEQIQTLADQEGVCFGNHPGGVYSVALTVWAFLTQILSKDKSCTAAVTRIIALLVALGRKACSANTGAYCKARAKLPERFLEWLVGTVGERLEDQAPTAWRWQGRRALLIDGTTILLADTEANQQAYPQQAQQAPGCGFPIVRLVVLLGLATAACLGAALGPYQGEQTGETALLRQLLDRLRPGDVLVADRHYCSYFMVALALSLGVDVVFRLHQQRHYDFRRGQRLGPQDHVVTWSRPARPAWMDAATYATMPATLTVRELRVHIDQPGCRVRQVVLASTLTDANVYAKEALADLYHDRWHVELDVRSIKTYLGMEMLRGRSPAMARKEMWMHLLAYNLVRKVQAQAGQRHQTAPRSLSFTATQQALETFRGALLLDLQQRKHWLETLLAVVAQHRVGGRPNRYEPRKVKRRWKTYDLMRKPRAEERAALVA